MRAKSAYLCHCAVPFLSRAAVDYGECDYGEYDHGEFEYGECDHGECDYGEFEYGECEYGGCVRVRVRAWIRDGLRYGLGLG